MLKNQKNLTKEVNSCWPTTEQELLLQAALLTDEKAVKAWEKWKSVVDIDQLDVGSLRLLPLLYTNLRRWGVSDPMMEKFKGLYRQTWCENQLLFYQIADVLKMFQNAGIQTLILKGAALSLLYYKDYGLRPMADFDILIPLDKRQQAIALLQESSWIAHQVPGAEIELDEAFLNGRHSYTFISPNNQELDLHWHLLSNCLNTDVDEVFWQEAVLTQLHSISTYALNSTDQFLHVCVHGVAWNIVPPLRWVADAMMILNQTTDLNWERLIIIAEKQRLILPLTNALQYLFDLFQIPILSSVLKKLQNLPVLPEEQLDYQLTTVNFYSLCRQKPNRILQFYYQVYKSSYTRYITIFNEDKAPNFIRFYKFLQYHWRVRKIWNLPVYATSKAMQALGKIVRWGGK
ncbi:MAG TPA: nucleotidyltransferase family protein [Oculatellaceae cyanobacterium]